MQVSNLSYFTTVPFELVQNKETPSDYTYKAGTMDFNEICNIQTRTACTDILCGHFSDPAGSIPVPLTITVVLVAVLTVELSVSFIGTILSFEFVGRNKPNFLVRVYAYTCIPVTLILAAFWLDNLPAFQEMPNKCWIQYCREMHVLLTGLLLVLLWIIAVLSCTISINLLQKLCNTYCSCCSRHRQPSCWRSSRVRVCLEILFIVLVIVVSLLIFAVLYGTELHVINSTSSPRILHIFGNITHYSSYVSLVMVVFCSSTLALSFISDIVLIVWFCKVRRKIARRGTIYKELVLFGIHQLVAILATLLLSFFYLYFVHLKLPRDLKTIAVMIVLALLTLFPFCVYVYMICSSRTPGRENRPAGIANRNLQTAGLQTAPDSTRVSLPSDTAALALNFLSPSTAEPTDVTPLLN